MKVYPILMLQLRTVVVSYGNYIHTGLFILCSMMMNEMGKIQRKHLKLDFTILQNFFINIDIEEEI